MKSILAILILTLSGCTPERQNPEIYYGLDEPEARSGAVSMASSVNGLYYRVAPTGSMEPFLTAGDWVAVERIDYSDIEVGMMAVYQARWLPKDARPVCHWVAAKQGKEFIMDGQANSHYESGQNELMGKAEFIGIVKAIYTRRIK